MTRLSLILLWIASAAAFGSLPVSSIALKEAVALQAGGPVRLADVAALSGPEAEALRDVEVASDVAAAARSGVTMDEIL